MKTKLIEFEHVVPKGSALEKSELELEAAMVAEVEAFFKQAEILNRILQKKEFELAGYKSFDEYMDDRQPFGIKRRRAWQLLAAKAVRKEIPDFDCTSGAVWTERTIRPLTHNDFRPADHKRIGKKIAKKVANGEKLSARLVQELCDIDRGIPQKRRREKERARQENLDRSAAWEAKQEVEFEKASIDGIFDDIAFQVYQWKNSFEEMDAHLFADLSKSKSDYLFQMIDQFRAMVKKKIKQAPIKREPVEV